MINTKDAEKNIKEFMNKHGVKGFLILYFAKYLLKVLKFQLKSKLGEVDAEKDPGFIFFTKNGKITNTSDIDKYETELYEICKQKAKIIVEELENDKKFEELLKGDFSKIKDTSLEPKFEKALHDILKDLGTKNGNKI